MLHFGIFGLLAIFWQSMGFRAAPIMNTPIASLSVAEFWGRRWNSGFRDLAHPLLFVPLSHKLGAGAGLWASFAVSGLLHELVISVPAGGGYGLPTMYFLIQALGICVERRGDIALKRSLSESLCGGANPRRRRHENNQDEGRQSAG